MGDTDDLINLGIKLMEARAWGDMTWHDLNAWLIGDQEELGVHRPPWQDDRDE